MGAKTFYCYVKLFIIHLHFSFLCIHPLFNLSSAYINNIKKTTLKVQSGLQKIKAISLFNKTFYQVHQATTAVFSLLILCAAC